MRVEIVVTHLLGTGHLARAVTLAQAFKSAGHSALVVSGGMPVARFSDTDIELHQLPPLRSDGVDFTRLLDQTNTQADPDYMATRRDALLGITERFHPDVLITELFPFGRRILRDEFIALLTQESARADHPCVFASVRDILAPPSKPKKAVFADDMIARFYDAVLVHADPSVTRLEQSWPVSETLAPQLRYTGFVAPPPASEHPDKAGQGEVIVSAGGGDVGAALFACACDAARQDPMRQWRILIGGANSAAQIAALSQNAPKNLIVEETRPDFRQMLYHAAVSVSFCGYNTAQDLLQSGCPAVLIPFDAGNEVEQSIRAKALAALSGFDLIKSADLTPDALLHKIAAVQAAPRRAKSGASDGAARTVEIVTEYQRDVQ